MPPVMNKYDWNEVPESQKNELPTNFRNVAFRRLFEKLTAKPGSIIKHYVAGPAARAILVDLPSLMDTEGLNWEGPTVNEIEYKLVMRRLPDTYTALIISTVEKDAIASLFEGNLPSYFVGVQNTPSCKKVFEEAFDGLGTEIEKLKASVSVINVSLQAEFAFYFIWRIYAGGETDNDGTVHAV